MSNTRSSFDELVAIMTRLRGEGGCPWDRAQTHETLKPYLIEEAYEIIEALDQGDDQELKEELGDLLLQVVFHAQMAAEEGRFDIEEVIQTNIQKLRRRHPHVFGNVTVTGPEEVRDNWEQIKQKEKGGKRSLLDGIPKSLPALLRARRVQQRASGVGFDWQRVEEVLEKVREEVEELQAVCAEQNRARAREELGDLLFSLVNLSRFLDVNPEDALQQTVDRFMRRFRRIEEELARRGKTPSQSSLEEMDEIWEDVKAIEALSMA